MRALQIAAFGQLLQVTADGRGRGPDLIGEIEDRGGAILAQALVAARIIFAASEARPQLSWLEVDKKNFQGTVKGLPVREELNEPAIREQYVVEYYSR